MIVIALKAGCIACGLISIWLFVSDSSLFKIIPVTEGNPHNLRNLVLMAIWLVGTLCSFFVILDWVLIGTRALAKPATYSKAFRVLITSLKTFVVLWIAILLLNQTLIFGACFEPYCIMAALPHTGAIALIFTFIINKRTDES